MYALPCGVSNTRRGENDMTQVTAKELQGRWSSSYYELNGLFVSQLPNVVELRDNQFKVYQNEKVTYEGTFIVGPGRDRGEAPSEIALTYTKSANPIFLGGARHGLVQLHGDTLKWVFGAVGHSAPAQLNTFAGSESVLSVYVKEGAKPDAPDRRASKTVAVW
jgi:hypothetical protein